MKFLQDILFLFFILITALLLASFKAEPLVWLSFFINGLLLFIILIYHIYYEKIYSPFLSNFIVFSYLFLWMAPIIQIGYFENLRTAVFPNNFPYRFDLILYANLLIFSFNLTFFIAYLLLKRKIKPVSIKYPIVKKRILPILIYSILFLSILIFIFTFPVVLDEIIKPKWQEGTLSKMYTLIVNKSLLFTPFGGIILSKYYLKTASKKTTNYYWVGLAMILLILLLIWFKNPLTEKRHALGPIYITLIYLFIPKLLNSNLKMMSFMFFTMIVLFPLVAILTHASVSLNEILQNPSILIIKGHDEGLLKVFHSLHYDAFSNILATVDYVQQNGLSWGYQLLGVLLFFIPRSIWTLKPLGTGQMIGRYLIKEYHFNFDNLSNPLVSEAYINFRFPGVIFGAIALAVIIKRFFSWLLGNHILKKYIAFYFGIYLMFLLRGDLLNATAYFIGILIAVLFIPFIIERLLIFFYYTSPKTNDQE